jgi:hypothetical protein
MGPAPARLPASLFGGSTTFGRQIEFLNLTRGRPIVNLRDHKLLGGLGKLLDLLLNYLQAFQQALPVSLVARTIQLLQDSRT